MAFLLLPEVAPFSAALAVFVLIGVIELFTLMTVGIAGLSTALDSAFHIDTSLDATPSGLTSWLTVRGMPLMVTIVTMLLGFGATGVALQYFASRGEGSPFGLVAALAVSVAGSIACIRFTSVLFSKFNLHYSSIAVSRESFIGSLARLNSPRAARGYPGEAQLTDQHGNTHYVMVEPVDADVEFVQGNVVELVSIEGHLFTARLKSSQ